MNIRPNSSRASTLRVTLAILFILASAVLLTLAGSITKSQRSLSTDGVVVESAVWAGPFLQSEGPVSMPEIVPCMPAWQNEPPITTARRNAVTVTVGSNLYAITGFTAGTPPYTDVNERFDGTSWSTLAPIPARHAQGRGAAVGTNIYVPGGFNSVDFGGALDFMQIYSTTTNTWSNGMPLPDARSGVAAAAFNNLVYVIAGYNPIGTGHTDIYIYDPGTNSYTIGAPMPVAQGNAPGVLFNGEIYVVGGGTAPGAHYAYNPTTNMWRTIASMPTTGGLCQSANGFAFLGEIWIVGCLNLPLNQQVWIYNPGTDMWRAGPTYAVDHQGPGAALFNNRGFVVGGGAASGGSTAVESVDCAPANQCSVCHKGSTLVLACNSLEYARHLDHGDSPNACSPPIPYGGGR